jgi:hypothetical protein
MFELGYFSPFFSSTRDDSTRFFFFFWSYLSKDFQKGIGDSCAAETFLAVSPAPSQSVPMFSLLSISM